VISNQNKRRASSRLVESPSPPVVKLKIRKSECELESEDTNLKKKRMSSISKIGHSNIGGHGSAEKRSEGGANIARSSRK